MQNNTLVYVMSYRDKNQPEAVTSAESRTKWPKLLIDFLLGKIEFIHQRRSLREEVLNFLPHSYVPPVNDHPTVLCKLTKSLNLFDTPNRNTFMFFFQMLLICSAQRKVFA